MRADRTFGIADKKQARFVTQVRVDGSVALEAGQREVPLITAQPNGHDLSVGGHSLSGPTHGT